MLTFCLSLNVYQIKSRVMLDSRHLLRTPTRFFSFQGQRSSADEFSRRRECSETC